MADSRECRSLDDLEMFVSRVLPTEQVDDLARHIEACARCAEAVDKLLAGDTLAKLIQSQAGTRESVPTALLRNLAEQAHQGLKSTVAENPSLRESLNSGQMAQTAASDVDYRSSSANGRA